MAHQVNVSDQFRKNELSLTPGGATIKVITANQKVMVYDKIKNIQAYANKAMKDPNVVEIIVNETTFWKRS